MSGIRRPTDTDGSLPLGTKQKGDCFFAVSFFRDIAVLATGHPAVRVTISTGIPRR